MSRLIDIDNEKFWDILFDEACVEGKQAERIEKELNKIIVANKDNNGWIPCSKELPPQPKENPLFENKPLELYLVSLNSTDYPWRAFWNGKCFSDGWSRVEPIAWQPLPKPYKLNFR